MNFFILGGFFQVDFLLRGGAMLLRWPSLRYVLWFSETHPAKNAASKTRRFWATPGLQKAL